LPEVGSPIFLFCQEALYSGGLATTGHRVLGWRGKLEAVAKPPVAGICHSERSEESRIFNQLRSFTALRMTIKTDFAIAYRAY
jgi:hypothetical protein